MTKLALLAVLLILSPAAADDHGFMGPIWGGDSQEDAGATAPSSQKISLLGASSNGAPLTRVNGSTSTTALLGVDSIDLYEITITNAFTFTVTTEGSTFDTILYLFKKVIGPDGSVSAMPIVANDDTPGATWSRITQPMVGGIPGLTAGDYFLAVAGYPLRAVGCTREGFAPELFVFSTLTGLAFPTTSTANQPLCDWRTASGASASGSYQINVLGGVQAYPPNDCLDAPLLGTGAYPFGDTGIDSESQANVGLSAECGLSGSIQKPTWVRIAPCRGRIAIDVCPNSSGASPYRAVLFDGSCGNRTPVACGVPVPPCNGCTIEFDSDGNTEYLLAFGPLNAGVGAPVVSSAGLLEMRCYPLADADINGDGSVDGLDLGLLLSQWGSGS
ncbi:MAG: hypothetical protein RL005_924 [Planctomycetota bacterium]